MEERAVSRDNVYSKVIDISIGYIYEVIMILWILWVVGLFLVADRVFHFISRDRSGESRLGTLLYGIAFLILSYVLFFTT